MTDLTALSDLPSPELRAEFSRMFGTPSPTPARPGDGIDSASRDGLAGVGDSNLQGEIA